MDQAKRTTDVSLDPSEQPAPAHTSTELRTLSELELVLCGGGDGYITWPG